MTSGICLQGFLLTYFMILQLALSPTILTQCQASRVLATSHNSLGGPVSSAYPNIRLALLYPQNAPAGNRLHRSVARTAHDRPNIAAGRVRNRQEEMPHKSLYNKLKYPPRPFLSCILLQASRCIESFSTPIALLSILLISRMRMTIIQHRMSYPIFITIPHTAFLTL